MGQNRADDAPISLRYMTRVVPARSSASHAPGCRAGRIFTIPTLHAVSFPVPVPGFYLPFLSTGIFIPPYVCFAGGLWRF